MDRLSDIDLRKMELDLIQCRWRQSLCIWSDGYYSSDIGRYERILKRNAQLYPTQDNPNDLNR